MAGPGIRRLCLEVDEANIHLFYQCKYSCHVLKMISVFFKLQVQFPENTEDFISWWKAKSSKHRDIPALFHWAIWYDRNKGIFNEVRCCLMRRTTIIL